MQEKEQQSLWYLSCCSHIQAESWMNYFMKATSPCPALLWFNENSLSWMKHCNSLQIEETRNLCTDAGSLNLSCLLACPVTPLTWGLAQNVFFARMQASHTCKCSQKCQIACLNVRSDINPCPLLYPHSDRESYVKSIHACS